MRTQYYFFLFCILIVFASTACQQDPIDKVALPEIDIVTEEGKTLKKSEAIFAHGELLFRNQCATCHNRNQMDDLTGPALANTEALWSEYPREDLYEYIRHSQRMIREGHPRAVASWDEWKPVIMTNQTNLTDSDIEAILFYIRAKSKYPEISN